MPWAPRLYLLSILRLCPQSTPRLSTQSPLRVVLRGGLQDGKMNGVLVAVAGSCGVGRSFQCLRAGRGHAQEALALWVPLARLSPLSLQSDCPWHAVAWPGGARRPLMISVCSPTLRPGNWTLRNQQSLSLRTRGTSRPPHQAQQSLAWLLRSHPHVRTETPSLSSCGPPPCLSSTERDPPRKPRASRGTVPRSG